MRNFILVITLLVMTLSATAQQWRKIPGPEASTIGTVLIHPADPTIMYALDLTVGGLYRSVNTGATWIDIGQYFIGQRSELKGIAVDPVDTRIIYASAGSSFYKTTDAGSTWTSGQDYLYANGILFSHPRRQGLIFQTAWSGLLRNKTGGTAKRSWDTVLAGRRSLHVAFDPLHPDTLVAVTDSGLYRSFDAGTTWAAFAPSLKAKRGASFYLFDAASTHTQFYLADSLYQTTNDGTTWTTLAYVYGKGIAQSPHDPNRMSVWGAWKLWSTVNHGATWTMMDSLSCSRSSFVFHPQQQGVVFAGTYNDIFQKSTDYGATWQLTGSGIANPPVRGIYPVTADFWYVHLENRIWKTTDRGLTWTALALPDAGVPSGGRLYSFAVDPQNSNNLYVGNNMLVYRSTNGGATWVETTIDFNDPVDCIAVNPANSNIVFEGGLYGMRKSTDAGVTFKPLVQTGIPTGNASAQVWKISRANPNRMFVACGTSGNYRTYITSDGGATWITRLNGSQAGAVWLHPDSELVAYAAGAGLMHTTDGGDTWTYITTTSSSPYDMMLNPAAPGRIDVALGGYDDGVERSTDFGATWKVLAGGSGLTTLTILAQAPGGPLLGAGYGGIYWFDPTPVDVYDAGRTMPDNQLLAQNFPNPFTGNTTIEYALPAGGNIDMRIVDVLGREVASISRHGLPAGVHRETIDASHLAPGMYLCRLTRDGITNVLPIIRAR